MSLESIVLCPPCLSLSLLFCLDLCLSRGGGVESPAPTRICEWAEGSTEEVSPGGRGASRFIYFSNVSPSGSGASSVIYFSEVLSSMRAGGGTERAASFGWQAPCPGHTHLGSSARRTSLGLRQDQRGPVRRRQILFCADTLCPLIPVACRGRLPVP